MQAGVCARWRAECVRRSGGGEEMEERVEGDRQTGDLC